MPDENYQRPLNPELLRKIVEDFDIAKFGQIVVDTKDLKVTDGTCGRREAQPGANPDVDDEA